MQEVSRKIVPVSCAMGTLIMNFIVAAAGVKFANFSCLIHKDR